MKYRSVHNYDPAIPAPTGDKFVDTYKVSVDDDGKKRLVKDGKKPLYNMIQASHEGCKIENIIRAYQGGNLSVLNKSMPHYADVTAFPSDLMGVYKTYNDARATFDSLPLEQRKEYNNNFGEWLAAVDNGAYLQKFAKKKESIIEAGGGAPATTGKVVEENDLK